MLTRLRFTLTLGSGALLAATTAPAAPGIDPAYGPLLKKYVSARGVNYAAWKANPADVAALERVVQTIAAAPASAANTPDQLAFHLNAYNAWILREKVNAYPDGKDPSVLSILPYFNKQRITVAGKKMSFNNLESDLIRPRFKEPRIHFALNCASVSCPPLLNEPFEGPKIGAQLDRLAKGFVNGPGVQPSADKKSVAVSKIFDWYKEDFAPAGGPVAFINKYRSAKIPANAAVTFQPYLWRLNETK